MEMLNIYVYDIKAFLITINCIFIDLVMQLIMLNRLRSKHEHVDNFVTDCAVDGECETCCGSFNFEDKEFTVKRGDYAPLMEKVGHYLKKAKVRDTNTVFYTVLSLACLALQICQFRLRFKGKRGPKMTKQ